MEFYQCTIGIFGSGVVSSHSVHFWTFSGSGATIMVVVALDAEVVEPGTAPGLASVLRTMPGTFSLCNFTVIWSFHIF